MTLIIRLTTAGELLALSDMCMRSKAVWGYDRAFLEACRAELTLNAKELSTTHIAVAERDATLVGVVQVGISGSNAELHKLFVAPEALRLGIGHCLFNWATNTARKFGAKRLTIESDPDAASFYRRMARSRPAWCDLSLFPADCCPNSH